MTSPKKVGQDYHPGKPIPPGVKFTICKPAGFPKGQKATSSKPRRKKRTDDPGNMLDELFGEPVQPKEPKTLNRDRESLLRMMYGDKHKEN